MNSALSIPPRPSTPGVAAAPATTGNEFGLSRRRFLQMTGGTAAAACLPSALGQQKPRDARRSRPNVLFIICDQLGLDALSGQGCTDVMTPNIDRLLNRSTSFQRTQSPSPVCSPARSSMFTGRMPTETGVVTNNLAIHPSLPMMGPWFHAAGYRTAYCGKWHLPEGYPIGIKGFEILPAGHGQGDLSDPIVSRSCEAFLHNHTRSEPFLLVASFLEPHDICYWAIHGKDFVPPVLAFPELRDVLPSLPPNFNVRPKAPARLDACAYKGFSEEQWRYYIYVYYRMVEMLDADVGRLLGALEASGQSKNTIVVFTSDHGEGRGRHNHVQKWYPYEEAVSVPLIVSWPGNLQEDVRDDRHLTSHVDIMATLCDLTGVEPPPQSVGRSLAPLCAGPPVEWRDHLVCDVQRTGRMVRTERYKYVVYDGDPVTQLFDMQEDPWETENLAGEARLADIVRDHRRLLAAWNTRLTPIKDGALSFGL